MRLRLRGPGRESPGSWACQCWGNNDASSLRIANELAVESLLKPDLCGAGACSVDVFGAAVEDDYGIISVMVFTKHIRPDRGGTQPRRLVN